MRQGNDLLVKQSVPLIQALTSDGKVRITHLDGRILSGWKPMQASGLVLDLLLVLIAAKEHGQPDVWMVEWNVSSQLTPARLQRSESYQRKPTDSGVGLQD